MSAMGSVGDVQLLQSMYMNSTWYSRDFAVSLHAWVVITTLVCPLHSKDFVWMCKYKWFYLLLAKNTTPSRMVSRSQVELRTAEMES